MCVCVCVQEMCACKQPTYRVRDKIDLANLEGENFYNQAGTLYTNRENSLRKGHDLSESFKRPYLSDYWAYQKEIHIIAKVSLLRV